MEAAKARYRSERRKQRFSGFKTIMAPVAKGVGVGLLFIAFLGGAGWIVEAASNNNNEYEDFPEPTEEELVEQEAAYQQFVVQSRAAGEAWARDFAATHQDCDARVDTKALELEGFDQKAWLEGCLTTVKALTQPEG